MKKLIIILAILLPAIVSKAQSDTTSANNSNDTSKVTTFTLATKAEFPGGEDSLLHFLSSNLEYPQEALENDVHGTVNLMFIIDKEGNVTDVEVVSMKLYKEEPIFNKRGKKKGSKTVEITDGYDYCLGTCAANLISNSPKWKPATQRDKNVNMRFRVPVRYYMY